MVVANQGGSLCAGMAVRIMKKPSKVAHFGPESVAHFHPESVAQFDPEWVVQFSPE
jgi:hypothetical protein